MEKKNFDVKKFTNFISRSSKQLLFFLLEDRVEPKKERSFIEQRLNEAASSQQLIVLHLIKDHNNQERESVAGFIVPKSLDFTKDILMLKPIDTQQPLRMISIHAIKKIAMLEGQRRPLDSTNQAK